METIKVKPWGEDQGDFVLINAGDFDDAVHVRFDDESKAGDNGLSAVQLKDELKKRDIEFKGNASREVLQGLYDAAVAAEAAAALAAAGSAGTGNA